MFGSVWQKWLKRVSRPTDPIRGRAAGSADRRLQVESLEDRVNPANNVSIVAGAGSLDAFFSDGILTSAEGGSADGTLSVNAITAIAGSANISVTALGSISFSQGALLQLQTTAGKSATFNALGGVVSSDLASSLATTGGNLSISARDGISFGSAIGTGGGSFTANADSNSDAVGNYVQSSSLATANGAVTITAADVQLAGTINGGTGTTTIQNSTSGRAIDLGTDTAGKLGLSATEISAITAGTIRVGSANAGAVNITAAITPGSVNFAIINGSSSVTETGGSITASNLRVTSGGIVSLLGVNAVQTLAGSGATGFSFNNGSNSLSIGTVDGKSGLATSNGDIALTTDAIDIQQAINAGSKNITFVPSTSSTAITLGNGGSGLGFSDAELGLITAGLVRIGNIGIAGTITIDGLVTRHTGFASLALRTGDTSAASVSQVAPISIASLAVQTSGGINLGDPGNDFDTIAAISTGGGSDVFVTDLNNLVIGNVDGVSGLGGLVNTVTLTAGSTTQTGTANVTGTNLLLQGAGPFSLTNTGNNFVTLAANIIGALAYTDADGLTLDTVGAVNDVTTVNNSISIQTVDGDLNVNQIVSSGAADLSLRAGGADRILDTVAATIQNAVGHTITLRGDRLALSTLPNAVSAGGAGIVSLGATSSDRNTNLDDTVGDPIAVNELRLSNAELSGISAGVLRIIGGTSATSNLTVVSSVANPATWDTLRLTTGGSILSAGASNLTVPNLLLQAGVDVDLSANVNVVSTIAGSSGGVFNFFNAAGLAVGTVDTIPGISVTSATGGVDLTLNTLGSVLAVNQPISTAGSPVSLRADNMGLAAGVNAGAGMVTLTPTSTSLTINLGGAGGASLGLTDAELDLVTASVLRIGGTTPLFGGNVVVSAPITQTGSGYSTLEIATTGSITNTGGSIAGSKLALSAGQGIGTAVTPLATQVSSLAFQNSIAGVVNILNTGGMTIANLAGLATSFNNGGATTLATTGGPLTFAVDTSSNGLLTVTAADTGAAGDNITVNSGVTVSTGGASNIILRAGDDIVLQPGSKVQAGGSVTLIAGFGDIDGKGALDIRGTISGGSGTPLNLTAIDNIALGTLNFPLSTITVTSTQGAITDGNDPPTGTVNIIAAAVNLNAARGIGSGPGADNPIEITTSVLSAINTVSGDIQIVNTAGNLSVSGSNTGGGAFAVTAQGVGSLITITPADITTNTGNGPIILTADDIDIITLGAIINAGSGTVTFQPFSNPRAIDFGSAPGTLSLQDAELDRVTAGTVRVGNATNTGGITISQAQTVSTFANLSLRTAGAIIQNSTAPISGLTGLALLGATGVNLQATGNDTAVVSAAASASGAKITYFDANTLSVGTVDGLSGATTNAAPIDIETFSGTLTVTDTPLANDIDSTGGNLTLISRGTNLSVNAGVSIRSGGGDILIQSNDVNLASSANSINAGVGRATVKPFTPGQFIDLGLVGPGGGITLAMSPAELSTLTAGTIQIGDQLSGTINVSGTINASGSTILSLQTGGGITESLGAGLTATSLAIRSANAVNLNQAGNNAGMIAGIVGATGQAFTFTDAGGLIIGTVDGVVGITTKDAAITVSTAGDLTINNAVNAGAGAIALSATAANAALTNNSKITNTSANPVTLLADRMLLGTGMVSTTGASRVTLAPVTAGRLINLGSTTDAAANTLELSDAEIDTITTAGVVQVGTATSGAVTVTAPVSVAAAALAIVNGGAVSEAVGGTLSSTALRVSSTGAVNLSGANNVGVLAANTSGAGNAFLFNNVGGLQIGNVDGISGVTTNNGALTVTTNNGSLLVNNNVLAGTGAVVLTAGGLESVLTINPFQIGGATVQLTADEMVILGVITAGSGAANIVTLLPFTNGRPVNLGPLGDPAGSLNLSDTELDLITAGVVRIGNANTGPITATAAITQAGSGYTVLSLTSGATITETGTGTFAVTSLAARGATGVDLTLNPNSVTNLSGTTTGAPFNFINAGDLFVATVDGTAGINTVGGNVTLQVNSPGGLLTIQSPITATNGNTNLIADDMDIQAAINNGTGTVAIQAKNLPRAISLGSNAVNTLGITDLELDRVTAALVRIGTATNTGNISLTGPISQAGSGYLALSLITGGAILDGTGTEQVDLSGATLALALSAVNGIGSTNDLNISVSKLSATNSTTGNIVINNAIAVTIPTIGTDGVVGITNNASGNVLLTNTGGITVGATVAANAGGNIVLTTNGAAGSILVNAPLIASGGSGNITLDASAATSGGSVTINDSPAAVDVSATGSGNITVLANDGVTIGAGVVVQSGAAGLGGNITIRANAGDAAGTADVTIGAGAQLLTASDITLNADPDTNGIGGTIITGLGTILGAPGGGYANNLSLTAAPDLVLPDLRAVTKVTALSTAGSLRDDGIETTIVQAPNISFTASKAVGGNTAITAADVTGQTGVYRGAIDYDLTGVTFTILQTGVGGNIQLRRVNSGIDTSEFAGLLPVGSNNQLALIAAGGQLTVDTAVNIAAPGNTNLLLAAEGAGNAVTVNQTVTNNGLTAPTTLVSSGGSVSVAAAVTSGGSLNITSAGTSPGDGVFVDADVTASGANSSLVVDSDRDVTIASGATIATTSATGGGINITAARNAAGMGVVNMASGTTISTSANKSAISVRAGTVTGAGNDITLATVTAGGGVGAGSVNVRAFGGSVLDANGVGVTNISGGAITVQSDGAAGINLDVFTATPTLAGLTAVTTNDPVTIRGQVGTQLQIVNVAAGTGSVNLSTTNGNLTNFSPNDLVPDVVGGLVTLTTTGGGTIGLAGPSFFEVDATNLVASTQNQKIWISDTTGGVKINNVNAGTETVVLQVNAGTMSSSTVDGNADVIGSAVILQGTNGGSFGTSAALPLEIDAATLTATTSGAGSISIRDTSGGLTAQLVQTANGAVNLETFGGNLTITQVNAGTGITTLKSTAAIVGTVGGTPDVAAGALAATAGTGITGPFETAVGTLAATTGTGAISIANSGALTIGSVGTVFGVTATGVGGKVTITSSGTSAASLLTVSSTVQASGDISLTAFESSGMLPGDNVAIGAGVVVNSTGGAVTLQAGDAVILPATATVQAFTSVTLNGGYADDGNGGSVSFLGTAIGSVVNVLGGNGPDTFTINPAFTISTASVNGQGGSDIFNVVPNTQTTFDVTGGNPTPPTIPGDQLNIDLSAIPTPALSATYNPASGYAGTWTFGGGLKPITFNSVETLTPTSNLTVNITDGVTTVVPGNSVTYTVTVSNSGPSPAVGAAFTLPLPSSLLSPTYTSTTTGGATGNSSGGGSISDSLNLPVGSTVTYTITGRVSSAATGTLATTATVVAPAIAPDVNGLVKTATDTDTLTPLADVGLTNVLIGAAPSPGGKAVYQLTIRNNGASDAQSVKFTDPLPAGTVFTSINQTGGPAFSLTTPNINESGDVVGTIGTLPAGASATFQLTLRVFASTASQLSNNASVTSTTPDPITANNSATATSKVGKQAQAARIVTGTGVGGPPLVNIFDATTGGLIRTIQTNDMSFTGGVNVGQGDVNGDGIPDIIVGTGVGGSANIRIYDGDTGDLIRSFFAYDPSFRGGVNVASGDINGDGVADIIAGVGVGGGANVRIFDGKTGSLIRSFFAYDSAFRGGVIVAAGDVDGDGVPDIIAGSGVLGGPNVRVFSGRTGELIRSIFAYDASFRTGVQVGAGDLDGDGFAEIITGSGPGAGTNVRVFSGKTGQLTQSFFAFGSSSTGGVSVSTTDANGDGRADIVAGAGVGISGDVKIFNGITFDEVAVLNAYDPPYTAGVFVG